MAIDKKNPPQERNTKNKAKVRKTLAEKQKQKDKYLIIKYGDVGEFAYSTGAFRAIKDRYRDSHVVLLTSQRYVHIAKMSGFFDEIWVDPFEKDSFDILDLYHYKKIFSFVRRIKNAKFRCIYDFQHSQKTKWYFKLLGFRKPNWSGNISWCKFPYMYPIPQIYHIVDRNDGQLTLAGIKMVPKPDISWLYSDISEFGIPEDETYALLILAGDHSIREKNWHIYGFADIAKFLASKGIRPVLIGAAEEKNMADDIVSLAGGNITYNLVGKTNFAQLAELARFSLFSLGGDTGVMHLCSLTECSTIFLLSKYSTVEVNGPYVGHSTIIQADDLNDLPTIDVLEHVSAVVDTFKQVTQDALVNSQPENAENITHSNVLADV